MKRPLSLFCTIICVILAVSAGFSDDYEEKYGQLDGKSMSISGTVEDIAFKKKEDSMSMILYLKEGVICYMISNSEPRIGSRVTVHGSAFIFENATNPGQFDARQYYEIIGIKYGMYGAYIEEESEEYSSLKDFLYGLRRRCSAKLDEALPENEAAVMKTMLLGEKSELDSDMKELYQRNGIAHILCISGLHISLLGMGIFKLLRKCLVMPGPSAILSSVPVVLYGVMTGFGVSSVRAIFMFCLSMVAVLTGRTYDMVTAVSVAGLLILARQPLYIYHSGFVFSFGCIVGIAFLIPTLVSNDVSDGGQSFGGQLSRGIKTLKYSAMGSGCMAAIGLPIYYWFYYQMPLYSSLLNFMVIPVMSILVPCGIFLIVTMYICPPCASAFRLIIVGILRFFDILANWADGMPFHYITAGRPKGWQVVMYIMVLGALVICRKKLKMGIKWAVVLGSMILLTIRFKPDFETCFIDVGQGDSILVRSFDANVIFPGLGSDHALLVDGGSSSVKEVGKYRIIPFLKYKGVSKLEAVVVTHPDEDHVNGILELLEEGRLEGIEIEELIVADVDWENMEKSGESGKNSEKESGLERLLDAAREAGIRVAYIARGDEFELGNAHVECLSPARGANYRDLNESSVTFRITHDTFDELLTGDLQGEAEEEVREGLDSEDVHGITLLKVAHHGSRNSTLSSFLDTVRPQLSVISCGEGNSYGHPHKEILERLEKAGTVVFRTDRVGETEVYMKEDEVHVGTFVTVNR